MLLGFALGNRDKGYGKFEGMVETWFQKCRFSVGRANYIIEKTR